MKETINTQDFLKKVMIESSYKKIVEPEILKNFFEIFDKDFEKEEYDSSIDDIYNMALDFYKDYNLKYYNKIINAIKNNQIIIKEHIKNSYTNTNSGKTYIKLNKNDADLFILVHEFAHYIDRSQNPHIIPDEFWFLSETYAFYMEKKLEIWLGRKYQKLILKRRENRMYFESKMLKAIKYQLKYEKMYLEKGNITEEDLKHTEIRIIEQYNYSNLVNYLLQYPIANVLSDYIIRSFQEDLDEKFYQICLDMNLYKVTKEFQELKVLSR